MGSFKSDIQATRFEAATRSNRRSSLHQFDYEELLLQEQQRQVAVILELTTSADSGTTLFHWRCTIWRCN
jgi:hypothetical protein